MKTDQSPEEILKKLRDNATLGLDKNGTTQQQLVDDNQQYIPAWKEKHKVVKAISAYSDLNGLCHYIIGKPTRSILDAMAQYEADGKTKAAQEALFKSCILAGDKTLLPPDVDLQTAIGNKLSELFKRLEVSEKEL
jgi:hypothetical protein